MSFHLESENNKIRHLNVFRPLWLNRLLETNGYSHASPRNGHVQVIQNYLLFIASAISAGSSIVSIIFASLSHYNRSVVRHFDDKSVTVVDPATQIIMKWTYSKHSPFSGFTFLTNLANRYSGISDKCNSSWIARWSPGGPDAGVKWWIDTELWYRWARPRFFGCFGHYVLPEGLEIYEYIWC
jgi:hypothetical protein